MNEVIPQSFINPNDFNYMKVYPVIMAGGSGTRFWPASRSHRPKQFLNIFGSKTMIEQTIERVKPLCREESIIIVGNEDHHHLLNNLFGENRYVTLEEPLECNTAPAIGLAAIYLRKNGIIDAPMIALPADHYVNDEEQFRSVLSGGCSAAKEKGAIVTIGMLPTRPETGYGYLQRGSRQNEINGFKVYSVKRFVEKPNQPEALHYLKSGDYFWNGGIFIFTPEVILEELQLHLPEVYEGLLRIETSIGEPHYHDTLRAAYQRFPSVSIDYGVMEKTRRCILTISGDFGWSDVGSWESLYTLRANELDHQGNLAQGNNILLDTQSTFVFNQSSQMLVGVGLKDIVIVNTDDVTLVADIKRSQDLKKVVEEIRRRGLNSLL